MDTATTNEWYVNAAESPWSVERLFAKPLRNLLIYRSLVLYIVGRDLKVRYKRSMLGIIWTVLAPLLTMLVLYFVFTQAVNLKIQNYAVFLS